MILEPSDVKAGGRQYGKTRRAYSANRQSEKVVRTRPRDSERETRQKQIQRGGGLNRESKEPEEHRKRTVNDEGCFREREREREPRKVKRWH